jgi:capsular polysaccharide biosynthesis protein
MLDVLAAYGFRIVKPEQHPVYEQAQIFTSAQVIVSPHGAALTNLVFCQPGTKVLEIFSPQYVNPLYYILSNQMELHYSYLLGEGPQPAPQEYRHVFDDNITVNIVAFRTLLEKVLGG